MQIFARRDFPCGFGNSQNANICKVGFPKWVWEFPQCKYLQGGISQVSLGIPTMKIFARRDFPSEFGNSHNENICKVGFPKWVWEFPECKYLQGRISQVGLGIPTMQIFARLDFPSEFGNSHNENICKAGFPK
jgi:hypothetical protein